MNKESLLILESTKALLENQQNAEIRLHGSSMVPTIFSREKIILTPITNKIKKGDIIFCQLESQQWVLHRVHEINGDSIRTKGDFLNDIDTPPLYIFGQFKAYKYPFLHSLRALLWSLKNLLSLKKFK